MTRGLTQSLLALASLAIPALAPITAEAAATVGADKVYAFIEQHDPTRLSCALRYGQDLFRTNKQAQFELYLAKRGVILALPGSNWVQREYVAIRQANPRLKVVACAETVKQAEQSAKRRLPLLPGITVEPCKPRIKALVSAGWSQVPGL